MAELNIKKALNKDYTTLERKILCAIFKRNDSIVDVIDIISPDMFTLDEHKKIYQAMLYLYKENNVINDETIELFCENNAYNVETKLIKKLFHESYTSLKIKETAQILKELYNRRYILSKLHSIIEEQDINPTSSNLILEKVNDICICSSEKISFNKSASRCFEDKNRILKEVDNRLKNPMLETGLKTGWKTIDAQLGGFYRKQLINLSASSGAGKSWVALETAIQMCLQDPSLKCLYFSLEMSKEELEDRAVSIISEISSDAIQRPRNQFKYFDEDGLMHDMYEENSSKIQEFRNKISNAINILSELNITIDDEGNLSLDDIIARIQRYAIKNNGIDLIFIDHTYLINQNNSEMNSSDFFGYVYYSLKNIAKKYNCIVYALHQLNMDIKNNTDRRPSIYNLRGSSQIIDNCDVLMLLYNGSIHKDLIKQNPDLKNEIDITFGKVRRNRLPDNIDLNFTNKGFIEKEPDISKGNISNGYIDINSLDG